MPSGRPPASTVSTSILAPVFERRRHAVEHRLHDRRHARHDDDVAELEAGRREIGLSTSSAPCGMRAMRRRASFRSSGL
jgi:hypothetical protein